MRLRPFLQKLEKEGKLKRIKKEVSINKEIYFASWNFTFSLKESQQTENKDTGCFIKL